MAVSKSPAWMAVLATAQFLVQRLYRVGFFGGLRLLFLHLFQLLGVMPFP